MSRLKNPREASLIRRYCAVVCLLIGLVPSTAGAQAEWPQFRGPNSSGLATGEAHPVEFGPGNHELWRLPLEAGHSSPCIAGDRLFLTTFQEENKQLAVICISRSAGRVLWTRPIQVENFETGHPSFNPASSSPATDGERVVAYFGSYGLICLDMQGELLWEIRMPVTKSYAGNATSPAIHGNRVFLYRANHVDHFLLAVNKDTGQELWRVPQGEPFTSELACTACPILAKDKLIIHSARSVQAFAPDTGERLWVTKCATTATSTPIIAGSDVLVAAWNRMGEPVLRPPFPSYEELVTEHDHNSDHTISPDEFPKLWIFHRPLGAEAPQNGATVQFKSADNNGDHKITEQEWNQQLEGLARLRARYRSHGLLAVGISSKDIVNESSLRTLETRGIPEVPSPIYDGQYVYFVKNGGVLTCLEVSSGKRVYQIRTGARGTHYASPLIAGNHLFTTAGNGKITVLKLGTDPEIVATNDMGAQVYATPAIVDGIIYVRTHHSLHAFGQP